MVGQKLPALSFFLGKENYDTATKKRRLAKQVCVLARQIKGEDIALMVMLIFPEIQTSLYGFYDVE